MQDSELSQYSLQDSWSLMVEDKSAIGEERRVIGVGLTLISVIMLWQSFVGAIGPHFIFNYVVEEVA